MLGELNVAQIIIMLMVIGEIIMVFCDQLVTG
jgi:hypothetical protein